MQEELPKTYDPKEKETACLLLWERIGCFQADPASLKPRFCIVIPPPNVTGRLHMGHALVNTLQDIIVRYKRMEGYEALWVPGTDHAGISTQTVVERHLLAVEGKRRHDLSRTAFLERVWRFKEESEQIILGQIKRLGASCDWSRLRFTMDEGNNRAVCSAFKQLFDRGLIYRGDYLVNWDPVTQTALADDEVEHEEQAGFLWTIEYPLVGLEGGVSVATTRPETLFGDVAVAVHPDDLRYQSLIGKAVHLPLTDRTLPIIADYRVDREFGTGAVKITPGHDPFDWQVALTHHLKPLNVMTLDGRMNEMAGVFAEMPIAKAREAVAEALQERGYLRQVAPHLRHVGISYRSKAVIEPLLSKQWFLKMSLFAPQLREAVASGAVQLIPPHWQQTYFHWIDNLRDWCISRQLWWGHRIPVWYHRDDPDRILCYAGEGLPEEVRKEKGAWVQEEDVLDTWFSSALWPFATLGWPDKTADLQAFYPNSLLVTGHDILFFWVARMLLMGHLLVEEWPFPKVVLHGLIYGKSYWRQKRGEGVHYCPPEERQAFERGAPIPDDVFSKWEKMSKTKGNVIDPLEMIELYGADAVRMTLASLATQARQIDLDERRFEESKHFANKIWNGARFIWMHLKEFDPKPLAQVHTFAYEELWILDRCHHLIKGAREHLDHYLFDRYMNEIYRFFWDDFCSLFLELSKPALMGKRGGEERVRKQWILLYVMNTTIRLLHPVAPFLTEELFGRFKERFSGLQPSHCPFVNDLSVSFAASCCAMAPFPEPLQSPNGADRAVLQFSALKDLVHALRHLRTELQLPLQEAIKVAIVTPHLVLKEKLLENVRALVRCESIQVLLEEPTEGRWGKFVTTDGTKVLVLVPQVPAEQMRKMCVKLEQNIARLELQLSQQEFLEKAPVQLVQQLQAQLLQAKQSLEELLRGKHADD